MIFLGHVLTFLEPMTVYFDYCSTSLSRWSSGETLKPEVGEPQGAVQKLWFKFNANWNYFDFFHSGSWNTCCLERLMDCSCVVADSGIISPTNYSKKGHLIVSSIASKPQITPEALSWHKNLKHFLQHASRPPIDIYTVSPFIDSWICMHAPAENT